MRRSDQEGAPRREGKLETYAVEFDLPGIGCLPADQAGRLAKAFGLALDGRDPDVRWVSSTVLDDTIRCVYRAPSEAAMDNAMRLAHLAAHRLVVADERTNDYLCGDAAAAA